ncbi:MAG TPA: exosortase/archaeosortase family protein [Candidatus Acidoferrales bacterium]|jgi:exosortase|nr:exosortase/archaeosortase family protein [Candidatus Acidoferrales bacterium]
MNLNNKSMDIVGFPAPGVGYPRALAFLFFCCVPLVLAWDSLSAISKLIADNGTFSGAPLIPLVSAFLVFVNRRAIFSELSLGWIPGVAMIAPGLVLVLLARLNVWELSETNQCSLLIFGILLAWVGGFVSFFGTGALRAARFPILFLIFMVPIPEPILSKVTFVLQEGSANVAEWFFKLGGIPYLRQDFVFALPGVAIRVADECSGIRSSLALLITTVLASHLFLRTTWKKLVLCAVVVPLAVFKNGLRITTLSALAIYVNPEFLYGNLHRHGGVVFFIIGLVPLLFLLAYFQRSEKRLYETAKRTETQPS